MVISSKLMTCVESRRWPRRKEEIAEKEKQGLDGEKKLVNLGTQFRKNKALKTELKSSEMMNQSPGSASLCLDPSPST